MGSLGVMMAGGNGERQPHDFYSTPAEVTVALIRETRQYIGMVVHEPACGDGVMAKAIQGEGFYVVATDLVDRGFGMVGVDFLQHPIKAGSVITNPPFSLAPELINHFMQQKPEFFALLLKTTFWNAKNRLPLYNLYPPKMILPLTWRVDFNGKGAPTMELTWFVWGSKVPDETVFKPLPRP